MNCLKCGRETKDDRVFCDSCLETMAKQPVRPGTAVTLPRRKDSSSPKKSKRHPAMAPQDQIRKLKKQRLGLWISVFLLSLALLGALAAGTYLYFCDAPKPGQNYEVAETLAPAN